MRMQKTGLWLVVLAAVLALAPVARADWLDNFDQATFDSRWNFDEPNPALGTVTLDTVNDYAHFQANGSTDMWTLRNNAPIMWTPSGQTFFMETHVMSPVGQNVSVAGITVYGGPDGANPNFSLGLDHWNGGNRMVKLQGLGNNNPSNNVSATGGEAWLRLECTADGGAGGVDLYTAKYKLNALDAWSTLATLDRDVPDGRMGLFLKTGGGGRSADFSYAAGSDPPPPPPPPPPPVDVGVWRLGDDDPGAAAGNIGNAQTLDTTNLNRSGDPTYSSNTPGAGSALSMEFDGNGDFYSVGSVVSTATDNFGIEAWVNADSFASNQAIAYNGRTSNAGWGLFRIGSNYGALYGGKAVFGSSPVTTGQWTHVALVRDNGASTFYVNGVPAGSYGGAPNTPAGSFIIGANDSGTEAFDGLIDHVRVFTFNPGQFDASQHLTLSLPANVVIPEPATMLAVVLGVSGLGGYIRKRRAGRNG